MQGLSVMVGHGDQIGAQRRFGVSVATLGDGRRAQVFAVDALLAHLGGIAFALPTDGRAAQDAEPEGEQHGNDHGEADLDAAHAERPISGTYLARRTCTTWRT